MLLTSFRNLEQVIGGARAGFAYQLPDCWFVQEAEQKPTSSFATRWSGHSDDDMGAMALEFYGLEAASLGFLLRFLRLMDSDSKLLGLWLGYRGF